jgi:hypothetical protein
MIQRVIVGLLLTGGLLASERLHGLAVERLTVTMKVTAQ